MAGHLLGIHPFDQPNVQESKDKTNGVLQETEATGALPTVPHLSPKAGLARLLAHARATGYLAILGYMTPSAQCERALAALRKAILVRYQLPTTAGYGPRYLTPPANLQGRTEFRVVSGSSGIDEARPAHTEQTPHLWTLAQAQAIGDLQSLLAHGREAVRINLGRTPATTLQTLASALQPTSTRRPPHSLVADGVAPDDDMGATPEVHIFQDLRELAIEAADLFTWLGGQAISKTGRFHVALSGGSTPETLYTTLVRDCGARVDWAKVQFFFGDERCVPASHPESNFGRANASLFLPLQISPTHIHPMKGEENQEIAAREYAKTLAAVFNVSHNQLPRFDLISWGWVKTAIPHPSFRERLQSMKGYNGSSLERHPPASPRD